MKHEQLVDSLFDKVELMALNLPEGDASDFRKEVVKLLSGLRETMVEMAKASDAKNSQLTAMNQAIMGCISIMGVNDISKLDINHDVMKPFGNKSLSFTPIIKDANGFPHYSILLEDQVDGHTTTQ